MERDALDEGRNCVVAAENSRVGIASVEHISYGLTADRDRYKKLTLNFLD